MLLQELQRTGGTCIHALVAVDAVGDGGRIPELGLDHGGEAAANQTQDALLGDFLTDTDAQTAQDALALVALDADHIGLGGGGTLGTCEAVGVDLIQVGVVHQTALVEVVNYAKL